LGSGATTKVNAVHAQYHVSDKGEKEEITNGRVERDNEPTRRGNQFDQRAQDRIIIKKPTARTKESRITAGQRNTS
jgi:hypothetical protein